MIFPAVTASYAAVFAIVYLWLSVHVVVLRGRTGIVHGDGGDDLLNRSIRTHGNFAEYVPFILLLTALLEMRGLSDATIHVLLVPLLVARMMHPIGMRQPVGSVAQYAWRATSTTVTWLVLLAAAILLLFTVLK